MKVLPKALILLFLVCLCLSVSSTQAEMLVQYTFDDVTGTTVNNAARSDLDGILVGSAAIVDDAERSSKVLSLDGVDLDALSASVTIDDPTRELDFSIPNKCTLTCWVKSAQDTGHRTVFSQGEMGKGVIVFFRGDTGGIIGNAGPGFVHSSDAIKIADGWTHLAVVMDDNITTFYINGVVSAPFGDGGDRHNSIGSYPTDELSIIGMEQYGTGRYCFNGLIDDFRLYNNALTGEEVNNVMNNVPEPGTWIILLGALATLAALRKKTG